MHTWPWFIIERQFGSLNNDDDNYGIESESALFQNSSFLFHVVQFVRCWWYFLELNSEGLYLSLLLELENRCLVFLSLLKNRWNLDVSRRGCLLTAKKSEHKSVNKKRWGLIVPLREVNANAKNESVYQPYSEEFPETKRRYEPL